MKKWIISVLIVVFSVLLLASCVTTGAGTGELPKKTELSILFIGNSFTYGNNMPWLFSNICQDYGYVNVKVDSVMVGSYTLEMFCDPENKYCKQIDEKFATESYDIVILQEQSIRPILKYDKFRDAAAILTEKARANGARVLLFETWGYAEGYPDLKSNGWTTAEMANLLAGSYGRLGEELGVEVVYCGLAFLDMYNRNPDIPLYYKDLKHPDIGGSYLVALTFFNYIFHADTTKVNYKPSSLSEEHARILKEAVMEFNSSSEI